MTPIPDRGTPVIDEQESEEVASGAAAPSDITLAMRDPHYQSQRRAFFEHVEHKHADGKAGDEKGSQPDADEAI